MEPLPPPFDPIKQGNAGTILGKAISMSGSLTKAVAETLAKAHNSRRQ